MRILLVFTLLVPLSAEKTKLSPLERVEIIRGLTAEHATAKTQLPRSKKPLVFESNGQYDKKAWFELFKQNGPAARTGDLIQITKVAIDDDKILLEINNGLKSGRSWKDRIEVGMGNNTGPLGGNNSTGATGTNIALHFGKGVPPASAAELKKMLLPIMDFEKRSASENFVESLPPAVQTAIKDKRAIEGMDKEQVLISMGRPDHKSRETVDGVDLEDWVFGKPPGKITFITFGGDKVVRVKESYAGLGGSTAPKLPVQ
jgi:hypothetical protein